MKRTQIASAIGATALLVVILAAQPLVGALMGATAHTAPPQSIGEAAATAGHPAAATVDRLQTFRTLLMNTGVGLLRVDAENRLATLDLQTRGDGDIMGEVLRLSWDGTDLRVTGARQNPILIPQLYADRFEQFYDELRAGGPNLQFTLETPDTIDPTWNRTNGVVGDYHRVTTPWAWDDGYAIYVSTHPVSKHIHRFSVYDLVTGEVFSPYAQVQLNEIAFSTQNGLSSIRDVPLHPDISSPLIPEGGPWVHNWTRLDYRTRSSDSHPPYHDALRRIVFEQDPTMPTQEAGATLTKECSQGSAMHTKVLHARWRVPQDSETLARLNGAQQSCANIEFRMASSVSTASPSEKIRSCYEGDWRVLNMATTPPTEIWSRTLQGCSKNDEDRDPYQVEQQMPLSAPLEDLAVEYLGELRIQCLDTVPSNRFAGVTQSFLGQGNFSPPIEGRPTLRWDCYPGWDD